jgi:hypothetical protein
VDHLDDAPVSLRDVGRPTPCVRRFISEATQVVIFELKKHTGPPPFTPGLMWGDYRSGLLSD